MSGNAISSGTTLSFRESLEVFFKKRISRDYVTFVCAFASLAGAVQGYITTASGMMLMDESFLAQMGDTTVDSFTTRFIVVFYAGEIVGALLSFPLSENLGRRATAIYAAVACILSIAWSCLTSSAADILTSRFFVGWMVGALMAVSPVYISEVSVSTDRGRCISFIALSTVVGTLLAGIIYTLLSGYSFGWRITIAIPAVLFLPSKIVGLSYVPESPRWLLARKTPAECLVSMRQLRRTNDVSREFNDIYLALSSDARLGETWSDILLSKSILYRLMVCCTLQLCQQLVGIQIITTFGSSVLSLLEMHSIILGLSLAYIAALMGTILALHKIDIWGRRFLMISGSIAMFLSWVGAAVCVYSGGLEEGKAELFFSSYILRFFFGSLLCLFAFFYSFSLGPVSWVVPAEVFPLRARGKASALTTAAHGASAVLGAWVLDTWLSSGYDAAASMLVFAGVIILLGIFVFLTLPETKNMMLEDMEEIFDVEHSGCCGCQGGLVGLRELTRDKGQGSQNQSEQSSKQANIAPLFEPHTLHKYSTGMRETKFTYYQAEDEEDEAPFLSPVSSIRSSGGMSGVGSNAGADRGGSGILSTGGVPGGGLSQGTNSHSGRATSGSYGGHSLLPENLLTTSGRS